MYRGYHNILKMIGNYKYVILLFVLVIFHTLNNYFWIKIDNMSIGCDTVIHTYITVLLHQDLKSIFLSDAPLFLKSLSITTIFFKSPLSWPTLVHFLAALIAFVSSDILFWSRFSSTIYFIILISSIYLLGKNIYSRAAGLIAAYLVSFYPGIFGSSRSSGLDLPLASVVCLVFYFLLRSDEFRRIRYSLFFGLSLGLGMLVKGQLLFFIALPLLYVIFNGFRDKSKRKGFILNVCGAFCLALLIASIWWCRIFSVEGGYIASSIFLIKYSAIVNNLIFYLYAGYFNISPIFSVMFIFSLLFYLRRLNKIKLILIFWFTVPFLIYSVIPFAHDRYIFPAFGAVALITAIGLLELPFKKVIPKLIFLLAILGVYQFLTMSYYERPNYVNFPNQWAHPPQRNNHELVMREFNKIITNYNLPVNNIAIIEKVYFSGDYCSRLKCILKALSSKNTFFPGGDNTDSLSQRATDEFLRNISDYEFIITFSTVDSPLWCKTSCNIFKDKHNENIKVIMDNLEQFEILRKDILIPERINVFF